MSWTRVRATRRSPDGGPGREHFWHGVEMREYLQDPAFTVTDGTVVVLERFRLVNQAPAKGGQHR